jgi:hypothetical protein
MNRKDDSIHTRSGVLRIRYFEGDDVLEICDGETMIFSWYLTRNRSSFSCDNRDKCGGEWVNKDFDDWGWNNNNCSSDW